MDLFKKLLGKEKTEPTQSEQKIEVSVTEECQHAPDEINGHGEYIKIGGSPIPGLKLRRILRGHKDSIGRIAWSPDGQYIASPSKDETIRIWDDTGECIRTLEGGYRGIAWSPNSKLLAYYYYGHIKIIEVLSGKVVFFLKQSDGDLNRLAWSPDANIIAASYSGGYVRIWDLTKESPNHTFRLGKSIIPGLSWSSSGKKLAASTKQKIIVWDVDGWVPIEGSPYKGQKGINGFYAISWSHDGKILASGDTEHNINIWVSNNVKHQFMIEGHTGDVISISFASGDRLLGTKSTDGTFKIWDVNSWKEIANIYEKSARHSGSLSFHPSFPILATLGENETVIRIWEYDETTLLNQAKQNINYTTAKLVLVGDSGVGKTGLGWRMAHNEFKEHASTHGQQFWPIQQLNLKRNDGTDWQQFRAMPHDKPAISDGRS